MASTTDIITSLMAYEVLDFNPGNIGQIDDERMKKIYELSLRHDVCHLVGSALDKCGLMPKGEIGDGFNKALLLAVHRCSKIDYEYKRICNLFESEKIPFIPLKGSVIKNYYPKRWHRTSCDIDILVKESDLDKAETLLCEKLSFISEHTRNAHDVILNSKGGVHLELHFNIKKNLEYIDRLLGRVWDYASPKSEGSYEHIVTEEYFLFHQVAHLTNNFVRGGCGLRAFLDLYILLERKKHDEEIFLNMIRECEIERFYEQILKLIGAWFMGLEKDELSQRVESYILVGGAYGSSENRVSTVMEKNGGKLKYTLKRIFLPYNDLKKQYPALEKRKWLTPFYQIRRWFRIIFGGRLGVSVNEIKTIHSVSNERANHTVSMMKEVGLDK